MTDLNTESEYQAWQQHFQTEKGKVKLEEIKKNADEAKEFLTLSRKMFKDNALTFLYACKENSNILNVYPLGSRVYGSHNEKSDYDYIIISKEYFDSDDINVHVYTVEQFKLLLDRHDIQALECLFLPKEKIVKQTIDINDWFHGIDKAKLRVSVSTIASNSWVKGKKKLIVSGDYDLNLALKSIFHSLRILDFGIQIASSGTIQNYSSMNWLLSELFELSEKYQREKLWEHIDKKYRKLYNSKASEFKALAPKDLSEQDNKSKLILALKQYNIQYNEELINEILTIFQK